MNPSISPNTRKRVIIALQILGYICLVGAPCLALLSMDELGLAGAIYLTCAGIVSAVIWFAAAIIVDAAHRFLLERKDPDDEEED